MTDRYLKLNRLNQICQTLDVLEYVPGPRETSRDFVTRVTEWTDRLLEAEEELCQDLYGKLPSPWVRQQAEAELRHRQGRS